MKFKVHGSSCFIDVEGGKQRQSLSVAHEKCKSQTPPLHLSLQSLWAHTYLLCWERAQGKLGAERARGPRLCPTASKPESSQSSFPLRGKHLLLILQVLPQQGQTLQWKSASPAHWTEVKIVAKVHVFHSQMDLLQMWRDPWCPCGTGMLPVSSNKSATSMCCGPWFSDPRDSSSPFQTRGKCSQSTCSR